jgi:hypothetical protein
MPNMRNVYREGSQGRESNPLVLALRTNALPVGYPGMEIDGVEIPNLQMKL